MAYNLTDNLTVTSITGFNRSVGTNQEDYTRVVPNATFQPAGTSALLFPGGVVSDPQLGRSNRLESFDYGYGSSKEYTQEVRLTSSYKSKLNFAVGAFYSEITGGTTYIVENNAYTALSQLNNYAYNAHLRRLHRRRGPSVLRHGGGDGSRAPGRPRPHPAERAGRWFRSQLLRRPRPGEHQELRRLRRGLLRHHAATEAHPRRSLHRRPDLQPAVPDRSCERDSEQRPHLRRWGGWSAGRRSAPPRSPLANTRRTRPTVTSPVAPTSTTRRPSRSPTRPSSMPATVAASRTAASTAPSRSDRRPRPRLMGRNSSTPMRSAPRTPFSADR